MNIIEFEDICLKIGSSEILSNVTFDVQKGDIFCLVGNNGAGKSSLIRILLGLTTSYTGKVRISLSSDLCKSRERIGSVIDSLKVNTHISAERYLHDICRIHGIPTGSCSEILDKVGLADVGRKHIVHYSLGMKRRLMIAGALVGRPDILVLDEPFNGIDPKGMAELRLLLYELSKEGITIFLSSHNIPELIKLATKVGVMNSGHFVDIVTQNLQGVSVHKTVIGTDAPKQLISALKKNFPDVYAFPAEADAVYVLGGVDMTGLSKIIDSADLHGRIFYTDDRPMNMEELLLWKMNVRPD